MPTHVRQTFLAWVEVALPSLAGQPLAGDGKTRRGSLCACQGNSRYGHGRARSYSAGPLGSPAEQRCRPMPGNAQGQIARALCATLRDNLREPLIVLLSHPWFGAEQHLPSVPALRGLFVQYPGQRRVRPVLAEHCECWESLTAGDMGKLAECLGKLLG